MAAAYKVFTITIPSDNGYATHPEMVTERVIPHLKEMESYAEMTHLGGNRWKLTTPHFGAEMVAGMLQLMYGFTFTETGAVTK